MHGQYIGEGSKFGVYIVVMLCRAKRDGKNFAALRGGVNFFGMPLRLGGLCSIFHPLCYSNMLEIIPIMLETMPQICLLCSNYAHNFWKEQMLFVFRNLNRPRANPLSIT